MLIDGIEYCDRCGKPRQVRVEEVMPQSMRQAPAQFLAMFATPTGLLPVVCDCHRRAEVEQACRGIAKRKLTSRYATVGYQLTYDEFTAARYADEWNRWCDETCCAWPSAVACGQWLRDGKRLDKPIPAVMIATEHVMNEVRTRAVTASLCPRPTAKRPAETWAALVEVGSL